jgi:hypothetical protein
MSDTIITNPIPSPEKVLKGDAGNASVDASSRVAEERHQSAMEEAMAAVTGTAEDRAGREIPMGEPAEDPMFQAMARYFEIHERNFKDASHDLGFIMEYMKNNVNIKGVNDIEAMYTFLRTLEDNLSPNKDFDTKRYQRVFNYLILREKADAMNRALSMLEKNKGKYGE